MLRTLNPKITDSHSMSDIVNMWDMGEVTAVEAMEVIRRRTLDEERKRLSNMPPLPQQFRPSA